MTPEEARAMPGAFVAYRGADGKPLSDEWLIGHYDCYPADCWEPRKIEEVIMVPVSVRTFMCHEGVSEEDDD